MIFSNKWDLPDLIRIAPIYAFFLENSNSIIVVLLGRREYNKKNSAYGREKSLSPMPRPHTGARNPVSGSELVYLCFGTRDKREDFFLHKLCITVAVPAAARVELPTEAFPPWGRNHSTLASREQNSRWCWVLWNTSLGNIGAKWIKHFL